MKDNKKQIEEIAKFSNAEKELLNDIYQGLGIQDWRDECIWKIARVENLALLLAKKYQPKLPEDSVVLTREEYTELKKYKTDWLNSEKMHLQAELEYTEFELDCVNQAYSQLSKLYDETIEKLKKYEEFNNNLIVDNITLKDKIELKGKETARDFLQLAYDRCLEKSFIKKVEELAKQFDVEIKDNEN